MNESSQVTFHSEKTALVWVVIVLSVLLLFSLVLILAMSYVIIKQASASNDAMNWQTWQDDL